MLRIIIRSYSVECPNCQENVSDFYGDVRGSDEEFECEYCGHKFTVPFDA